jgi:hypothetical protein
MEPQSQSDVNIRDTKEYLTAVNLIENSMFDIDEIHDMFLNEFGREKLDILTQAIEDTVN